MKLGLAILGLRHARVRARVRLRILIAMCKLKTKPHTRQATIIARSNVNFLVCSSLVPRPCGRRKTRHEPIIPPKIPIILLRISSNYLPVILKLLLEIR